MQKLRAKRRNIVAEDNTGVHDNAYVNTALGGTPTVQDDHTIVANKAAPISLTDAEVAYETLKNTHSEKHQVYQELKM